MDQKEADECELVYRRLDISTSGEMGAPIPAGDLQHRMPVDGGRHGDVFEFLVAG